MARKCVSAIRRWFGTRKVAIWQWIEKIGLIAIGHTGKKVEEFLTDQLLYGAVSAYCVSVYGWYGPFATFCIMAPISILFCRVYLRLYDWAGVDLFGFELLKEVRDGMEKEGRVWRIARKVVQLGDIPAIFALSILFDPFMTTVYMRQGAAKYDGLDPRSRRIFWYSVAISNGFWSIRWSLVWGVCYKFWPYLRSWIGWS